MPKVTMAQMIKSGVHFGHKTRSWNPKMAPYIYGSRNKVHIINLEKTVPMFNDALNFVSRIAANRGKVLFVGTKYAAQDVIREEAVRCGMPYVNHRWLGGMLTNFKTVGKSIGRLKDLLRMQEDGTFEKLTKKEALTKSRQIIKLEQSLGGIKDMGGLPDALFVVDVGNEKIAIDEARRLRIPVIGVVDTNNIPDGIDYVVPGNDDAIRAIKLYAGAIAETILEAKASMTTNVEPEEEAKEEEAATAEVGAKSSDEADQAADDEQALG